MQGGGNCAPALSRASSPPRSRRELPRPRVATGTWARLRGLALAAVVVLALLAPGSHASARRAPGEAGIAGPRPGEGSDSSTGALAGQIVQGMVHSVALGRDLPYEVYLPPGYADSSRRYPTLYLLHGMNGSCESWASIGLAPAADRLIREGRIQPMLVVMPEGEKGYWLNHADGGPRWGDYLLDEVVPLVDSTYRTLPARQSRAIGGNSMGGHGALQTALNHPDLFAVVGAHSPGLRRYTETFPFFGDPDYFAEHDPLTLARVSGDLGRIAIWVDTGEEDPWRGRAQELHDILAARGAPHEWRLFEGKHDRAYWHDHLGDYLLFYSRSLRGDE